MIKDEIYLFRDRFVCVVRPGPICDGKVVYKVKDYFSGAIDWAFEHELHPQKAPNAQS